MKYKNILSRVYNVPLCITQEKLLTITSSVTDPLLLEHEPSRKLQEKTVNSFHSDPSKGIAVLGIYDTLVSKGGLGSSGFTSYQSIEDDANRFLSLGYSTIVFDLHTPGGESAGLFALMSFIQKLHTEKGIRTIGFTDGFAASAGYGIMAACSERYATPSAFVGSIGTIIDIVDFTKLNKKEGIKHNIIRSKSEKALGNPNESVTSDIIAKFQAMVNEIDQIFHKAILSNNEKLSIETIINTKGNILIAEEALKINLIDGIVDHLSEVIDNVDLKLKSSETIISNKETMMPQTIEQMEAKLDAVKLENAQLKTEASNLTANAQQMINTSQTQERERCLSIMKSADTLGISSEATIKRIQNGSSAEDSLEIFTAIAEATGKSTSGLQSPITESSLTTDRIIKSGEDSLSVAAIIQAAKEEGVKA